MTQDLQQDQAHSVWLVPEPDAQARLYALIAEISAAFALEPFAPHITLLGDLHHAPALTAQACQLQHSSSGPICARISNVARTGQHFMSLFLDMALETDLGEVRRSLSDTLTGRQPSEFRPHISLAYGLEEDRRLDAGLGAKIDELLRSHITFDRLCVVRSAKSVPVQDWRILSELDLNHSR